jgi:hypothetical protein
MSQLTVVRFTIENGETESNAHDVRDIQILAFQMPADWTTATLGFKARPIITNRNPGNDLYQDVVDDEGDPFEVACAADQYVVLTGSALDAMAAVAGLKLVSENAQGAEREILAVAQPMGG